MFLISILHSNVGYDRVILERSVRVASKKLTSKEVASKRFTPVRMREGYAMDEVDTFLEKVQETLDAFEAELSALNQESIELRKRPSAGANPAEVTELKKNLDASSKALIDTQAQLQATHAKMLQAQAQLKAAEQNSVTNQVLQAKVAEQGKEIERLTAALEKAGADVVKAREEAKQARENREPAVFDPSTMDISGASATVARLLENGAKQYDALIADAKAEAAKVIKEAERIKEESLGGLEGEKKKLESRVSELRGMELKFREQLRHEYSSALTKLQSDELDLSSAPKTAPIRLDTSEIPSFND